MKRKNLVFCIVVFAAVLCITAFLLADIHQSENAVSGQDLPMASQT